ECGFESRIITRIGDDNALVDRARRLLNITQLARGGRKSRVEQNADQRSARYQLTQQPEALRLHKRGEQSDAGRVAAGTVDTLDQPGADRIAAQSEHDRDGRGGALGRERRRVAAGGRQHAYPAAHEIGRYCRQKIVLAARPAELDRNVLALDEATLSQAATERLYEMLGILRRARAHEPNHWRSVLLRAHGKRPCCSRTGDECDELAPSHSITSSAATCSVSGTFKPSAFAALRLITSSNLVG